MSPGSRGTFTHSSRTFGRLMRIMPGTAPGAVDGGALLPGEARRLSLGGSRNVGWLGNWESHSSQFE